nr:DUF1146 domain-containing protein [Alicyclobacillus mali (ex Roth et al. 2021)]
MGADGIVLLLVFFLGVVASWWALGALRWDKFTHQPFAGQAQLLRFFLALAGGVLSVIVGLILLGAMQLLNGAL